jgi:hypothetical protein
VSRLSKLTALLLAALWLPATTHCQLENLGFDALFACVGDPAQADGDSGNECANDGCQLVESGHFTVTQSRVDVTGPAVLAATGTHLLVPAGPPPGPAPEIFAVRQNELLPLLRTWQFVHRAALPARAPDALNA